MLNKFNDVLSNISMSVDVVGDIQQEYDYELRSDRKKEPNTPKNTR